MIYYNADKAAQEESRFNQHMTDLHQDLVAGKKRPYWEKDYTKYFTVTNTPKRWRHVVANEEVMRQAKEFFGYFTLLSNEVKDPETALALNRSKDVVEKAFGNLKDRLNAPITWFF